MSIRFTTDRFTALDEVDFVALLGTDSKFSRTATRRF